MILRATLLVLAVLSIHAPAMCADAQVADSVAPRWAVRHRGVAPLIGVRKGEESGAALSFGAGINGRSGMESWSGTIVAVEPGTRALRVSVGRAALAPMAIHGVQVRATFLRTWADGGPVAQGQSFVGPELRLSFMLPSVGVGRYWRVRGEGPGDASFWAMTYGLGF